MDNSLSNKINGNFKGKDIISLDQFSQKDIKILFSLVPKMREIAFKAMPSKILAGKIVVLLFYEPSSRTFGSFSTAVKQIGGQTVEILNPQQFSSVVKGETFEDTIRVFEAYSDAIVLRHPTVGAASKAAEIARLVPIVNAGNGIGEHPTQALLDLYTIYEKFENIKDYEKVKNKFVVSQKFLDTYAGKHTILMHPLPRVGEILPEVDNDPRAIYLKTQIRNGTYVRMALLALVLGKS